MPSMTLGLIQGAALARGVSRHLRSLGFSILCEFVPAPGLRVDVIALKCEIWIVECKSCRADFASDRKWESYLPWCDRFFWAVGADFPVDILPAGSGLLCADPYDAAILSLPEPQPLASARRRVLVERFARVAADRLAQLGDPDPARRFEPPRGLSS